MFDREGRREPKPHVGGRAPGFEAAVLRPLVVEQNDRTLAELAAGYSERTGQPISPPNARDPRRGTPESPVRAAQGRG